MVEEEQDQISYELALKLRDLETGQKLMKERILLISQNFIDTQEKTNKDIVELKKQVQNIQTDLERIKRIVESLSGEVSKSARKEDVAMIRRQFKLFEPLKNKKTEDIEKLIEEKMNRQPTFSRAESFWAGRT